MDRKALTRAYKEARRPMGVFRVRNTVQGRSLLGSSLDIPAMLNRQRFQLETGAHPSRPLQEDWVRLGSAAFVIEALDTLEPPDEGPHDPTEDLRTLEKLWREKLAAQGESEYPAAAARRS